MLLKLHMRIAIALLTVLLITGCAKEPVAFFSAPALVGVNQPVQFSNYSVDAKTYLWEFGDGATSTDENPTHAYTLAGTYTVTLTAISGNGKKKDVATQTIEVDMLQTFVGSYLVQQNCTGSSSVSYSMQTFVNNGILYLSGFDMVPANFTTSFVDNSTFNLPTQYYNNITYSGTATINGNNFSIVYTKIAGGDTTTCTANCTKQ